MKLDKKTLVHVFLGVGICIVLYWLLHETERVKTVWRVISGVLSPFVVGAALAFILNVPMRAFEKLLKNVSRPGLRRVLALILTLAAIVLILALVFYLLIPQVTETVMNLVGKLPNFFSRVEKYIMSFLRENPQLMTWLNNNTNIQQWDWSALIQRVISMAGNSLSTIFNGAYAAIGSIAGGVMDALIGLVFGVYCLFRKEILARQGRRILYSFVPEKISDEIVRILRLTNSTFSNFISGQCLEALILGSLFAIAMSIFRMPYMPLISVLIAVTAFVPLVGAFVGCFLGAFFILVDDPLLAVWFVVMFLVIQQIEGNMIYPRVVGTSIGLPGMWVLVAVAVGGDLMGIGGMLLMIPLASVLYTLMREVTDYRLDTRKIPSEKLQDHPPELTSKFKEKRQRAKQKRSKRNEITEDTAAEE